ncbi:unnamed protein product [Sympodiomycopsis kandeliae]
MATAGNSPGRANRDGRRSRCNKPSYALIALGALASSIALARPAAAADFPSIDFDALGSVGVAGNFAGLQIWDIASSSLNSTNVFSPNASTIIERSPDGTLNKLNATEPGGTVTSVCGWSKPPHSVFVGGNFTRMGGVESSNIVSYDPTSKVWDPLAGGLDGPVDTVLCMDDLMIAGGNFTAPKTATPQAKLDYHGSVAAWNYTSKAWQPVDFGGLNGPVHVIQPGSNASSIQVGGAFDTQFGVGGLNGSQSGTNTSASSLTDKLAPLSLAMSLFEGGPASPSGDFNMAPQVLCPQGADGPGNTFLFEDNKVGSLRVSLFQRAFARAFRLGNTFHEGRGTQNFSITSLPDNKVLELLYLDPITKKNATCTTDCVLHHDAAIPYQDFLITNTTANNAPNGTKTLSGFVLDVKTWYGASAGLHMLEVLSDGAWAKAWDAYNRGSCDSPEPGINGTGSGVSNSGGWYPTSLATEFDGVPANVLQLSDSYSNIGAHSSATVSFNVDVAVTGNYSAYLHVPGCQRSNQCDQRTEVIVTVLNNQTNPGTSRRISQNVADDTDVLIWEGPISATTQDFMPSFVLSIPSNAAKPSGNDFTVVADQIRLQLSNSNRVFQMADSPHGFGVFEYNVIEPSARATAINASAVIPNSAINPFNSFGFTLASQGLSRNNSQYVNAIATVKDFTFVGGSFGSSNFTVGNDSVGFRNIVAYDTRQNVTNSTAGLNYTRLASGGVNGTVTALTPIGDFLYVGGDFTGLADSSAEARYIARYDPVARAWAALAKGPDGPVTDMAALGKDGLLVSGNFTTLAHSRAAGGYAVWNTTTNSWMSEKELLIGQIQSVSVVNGTAYMVGSVEGVSANAASGAVSVAAPDKEGQPPKIQVLNFNFLPKNPPTPSSSASPNSTASPTSGASRSSGGTQTATTNGAPASSTTNIAALVSAAAAEASKSPRGLPTERVATFEARSGVAPRNLGLAQDLHSRAQGKSLLRGLTDALSRRTSHPVEETHTLIRRADAMEPTSLQSTGDSDVLASAFWQRSDGSYMTVIGGNFTTSAGISNLAIYDPVKATLYAFPAFPSGGTGNKPTIFRALTVVDDTLYAGGDGGMVTFDLAANKWASTGQSLAATAGSNLTVTAIGHRPDSTNIIVAGTFGEVGMLPCKNVCLWDTASQRWQPLGSGVDGQISSLDFAGSKASNLILAGSLTVNNQHAALATYDFNAQAWSPIGAIGSGGTTAPGPATAASVDDLNINSIFAAGRTSDGGRPWLAKWDGTQFNALQSSELKSDSGIAQLTFVPITKAHPSNDILENNRLLVVSGALSMQTYGNVSSAFFDGHNWTPFLITSSAEGGPGVVRTFTRSTEVLKFPNLRHLAVGLVILISIAIGLGVVFLLVLLGLLVALARRRPQRGVDVPISPSDEALASQKQRPSSLLATLNAATENVMGAGAAGGAAGAAATSSGHGRGTSVPLTSEGHDYSDPSSQYHSEAPTGPSQYYTTDDSGDGHHAGAAAAALGAGAGAAGAAAARDGDSEDGSEQGVDAHMRFSFEATHPSELAVRAGDSVTILDDADEHWWLARADDGRVGVVPASYVL